MITRGEAVGVLILSEVVIGGVVALLLPTDRVVWIMPASRLTRSRPADPATSQEQQPFKDNSRGAENYFTNQFEGSM
jgi:hypothetical protein